MGTRPIGGALRQTLAVKRRARITKANAKWRRTHTLALHSYPSQPTVLCTAHLARMRLQSLPPSFPSSLRFSEVLAKLGRHIGHRCLNATAVRDLECYTAQVSSYARATPPFLYGRKEALSLS